jgi:hypothetical protein
VSQCVRNISYRIRTESISRQVSVLWMFSPCCWNRTPTTWETTYIYGCCDFFVLLNIKYTSVVDWPVCSSFSGDLISVLLNLSFDLSSTMFLKRFIIHVATINGKRVRGPVSRFLFYFSFLSRYHRSVRLWFFSRSWTVHQRALTTITPFTINLFA